MKKFFIISLLVLEFICNTLSCLALDDFDYGLDEADKSFTDTITVENTNETTSSLITFDFVPLLKKFINVPVKENLSALVRNFCNLVSLGYDSTYSYIETYCGNNSNYLLTISSKNETATFDSLDGRVEVIDIPEGEFSAYIKNNDDKELFCNTSLLGYGLDTTPEEGYNINLTCYDKLPDGQKTNMWYWLGPVIGVVGAAGLVGGGFVVKALHGASDASSGEVGP